MFDIKPNIIINSIYENLSSLLVYINSKNMKLYAHMYI